jgi:hypothetical protein
MTLTIITITLNNCSGLHRTLESVAAQTEPPDEHWIIDGGSTDGTTDLCAQYASNGHLHIRSEPDNGIYDAMNKGLSLATGDFVWFLNAGDTCASNGTMACIVTALAKTPQADGIYGQAWFRSRHGLRKVGRKVTPADFRCRMPICHQAIIYRRELALANAYSTTYALVSDWIVTRSLFEAGARFEYIDQPITIYDLSGVSSQQQFKSVGEKLRYEAHWKGKLLILCVCGTHALNLWLAHKTGLHALYKRWEHSRIDQPISPEGTTFRR